DLRSSALGASVKVIVGDVVMRFPNSLAVSRNAAQFDDRAGAMAGHLSPDDRRGKAERGARRRTRCTV
ncbi:hypothetical protein, partial [Burkholderia sp. SIMBA_024]|uniref:hypothetical protein n=1 Tax=Burkholderia sp. SIMBA_024 TaxID=3085768 RepID=UPI0039782AE3